MSETKQQGGDEEPAPGTDAADSQSKVLQEGLDYYIENGLMVFTGAFLQRRAYCCESGCRHCPYGYTGNQNQER